jgi:hypothetical protein
MVGEETWRRREPFHSVTYRQRDTPGKRSGIECSSAPGFRSRETPQREAWFSSRDSSHPRVGHLIWNILTNGQNIACSGVKEKYITEVNSQGLPEVTERPLSETSSQHTPELPKRPTAEALSPGTPGVAKRALKIRQRLAQLTR